MQKSTRELAKADYMSGMKYQDIAEKYGVSLSTVKSWKTRYGWERSHKDGKRKVCKKSMQRIYTKKYAKSTQAKISNGCKDKELKEVQSRVQKVEEDTHMNDRHYVFALHYFYNHNATLSYRKVYGSSHAIARMKGWKLLKRDDVQAIIKELRKSRDMSILCSAADVVDLYMRIAFADYTDFFDVEDGKAIPKPLDEVDTQMLNSISMTKNGIEYHLADRMKALQWLSDYFELNPNNRYRAEYMKKMAELREREVKTKEEGW